MSSGKKKKSSKKSSSKNTIVLVALGVLAGVAIVGALIWGGLTVSGQRKTVASYHASVTKITEALKSRDPESIQGSLQLSELEALITGAPTATRETQNGKECAVYTWPGGVSPIGFRLILEKNGTREEVVELVTFGAQP